MIPRGRVPAIMIATESLAVVALIVDSVKRSSKVEPAKQQYSPEQYSGFWHRAIFAWLAATFRSGYTRVISVDDLPHLDSKLGSDQLHHQLISVWDKCKARKVMLYSQLTNAIQRRSLGSPQFAASMFS